VNAEARPAIANARRMRLGAMMEDDRGRVSNDEGKHRRYLHLIVSEFRIFKTKDAIKIAIRNRACISVAHCSGNRKYRHAWIRRGCTGSEST